MSIEADLNRIANALEFIAGSTTGKTPTQPVSELKARVETQPKLAKANKTSTTGAATPLVVAVVEDVDPFAIADVGVQQPEEITFEKLSDLLKKHAATLGTKTTIALIQKHGADAVTPKLNTIPTANYKSCFDEATKDLTKVKA